jgi:hypothetical protein
MPRLVISYRRDDSKDVVGRIRDRLATHYGDEAVYMDVDDNPAGVDFRRHFQRVLDEADTLVVIIGPKWLGAARGKRSRIDEPGDPVRVEIESALQKEAQVAIVPVLSAARPCRGPINSRRP